MSAESTWQCPKCPWFYHSPVKGTQEVSHPRCPGTHDMVSRRKRVAARRTK